MPPADLFPLPRPDALPLARRGPNGVGVRTERWVDATRDRPLSVELWYPAVVPEDGEVAMYENVPWLGVPEPITFTGRALRGAPPCGQDASVVLYAHGAPGSRLQSTRLCEHLASHGLVVAAIDFAGMTYGDKDERAYVSGLVDRPLDMTFVLDAVAGLDWLGDAADTDHAGVIGYSFGGHAALAACGAGLDFESLKGQAAPIGEDNIGYVLGFRDALEPLRGKQKGFQGDGRLRAAFLMAPWNSPALDLGQVTVPLFVAAGECDAVAPLARDARPAFERTAATEASLLIFERGGHNLFTDPCPPEARQTLEAWGHCSDPVWDKERSGDILQHCAAAFFRLHLLSDKGAAEQLQVAMLGGLQGLRLETR